MHCALKKPFIFSLSSLDFFYLCISQFYNSVRQTFKKSLHDNGQEKMQVFSYAIFIMHSKQLFCWRKGKNYSDISAYITMKILAG